MSEQAIKKSSIVKRVLFVIRFLEIRLRFIAILVVTALMLIPVSLLPSVIDSAGWLYFYWALALGTAQWACAVWFMLKLDERSARILLRASLIYLPSLLLMLILGPYS